ncbi:Flavocytochrome yedZ [Providencia rustigianii]|nr:Flavocytochrome yedZ [Providencia rustigianii]
MPQENRWLLWGTKAFFHLVGLLPLLWLIFLIDSGQLGADPAKDIQHYTGIATLRLLVLIALIPLAVRLLRFNILFQTRKLLGLWCFFWAALHLSSYLLLEIGVNNLALFFDEVFSRVYLILGMVGWLCLFLMAIQLIQWHTDPLRCVVEKNSYAALSHPVTGYHTLYFIHENHDTRADYLFGNCRLCVCLSNLESEKTSGDIGIENGWRHGMVANINPV